MERGKENKYKDCRLSRQRITLYFEESIFSQITSLQSLDYLTYSSFHIRSSHFFNSYRFLMVSKLPLLVQKPEGQFNLENILLFFQKNKRV
ncbi:hypothetical protein CDAR_262521 [Caerostris darwini]|uniref:Maturase K n=1 Tax=Caerostris darwini TaxID=1538125 RepID=A0AAV4RKS2_9ARAC|nr:hypothetical protein CDAR_262521 [Caerostris darwini]